MGKLRIPIRARGFTYYQDTPPENPSIGDTWYDTSSGMGYVYEGGWVPYKKDSECWEKNPAYLKIEPFNATIYDDGGSVSFTVTIKNMDVGVCGNTTFTLTVHDSNTDDFEPSTLSQTTVTLGPYQETTVTLTVTDKVGAAVGSGRNDVYVTAEAADHPTSQSNTVSVNLIGAAAECIRRAPSVSISPTSQTIDTDGGSVDYTVTITNNDAAACGDTTTFTLTVVDSNTLNFEPSVLSQTSVTLVPGASETVTLTVTDKANDYPGAPTTNDTYVVVEAVNHPTVNSNTVSTVIEADAAQCTPHAPTVTISPSSQEITVDGGSVNYTVTVTNNDNDACGPVTFSLSVTDSNTVNFEPSTLSQTTLTLGPGESGTVTLTVSDKASDWPGSSTTNDTYVTVTATDHPTVDSNTVTTTISGEAAECARRAPSVSISPASQTITADGGSVNYTVTITNNDLGGCGATTFDLSVTDSDTVHFNPSTLSQTSVTLDPGASTTVTLTVSDKAGDYPGSPVSNSTYVTVTSTVHGSTNSNTVTTTIESGAVKVGYGYVCGGTSGGTFHSIVDRFTFPFNGLTATHVGNLSSSRDSTAACSSSVAGYVCSGYLSGSLQSTIDRFVFPFDSGAAAHVGNLSQSRITGGACSSSTYGYACGGYTNVFTSELSSAIDRFAFPFTGGTSVHVGNLVTMEDGCSTASSTHGYVCGILIGDTGSSFVERFAFPFSGGVASRVGNLSGSRRQVGACSSSVYGYACAGYDESSQLSTVDRFAFPFDSGIAAHVGNLSGERYEPSACSSTSYGYVSDGGSYLSIIDRFAFPFSGGTASHVGNLSLARESTSSCSNVDPHFRW